MGTAAVSLRKKQLQRRTTIIGAGTRRNYFYRYICRRKAERHRLRFLPPRSELFDVSASPSKSKVAEKRRKIFQALALLVPSPLSRDFLPPPPSPGEKETKGISASCSRMRGCSRAGRPDPQCARHSRRVRADSLSLHSLARPSGPFPALSLSHSFFHSIPLLVASSPRHRSTSPRAPTKRASARSAAERGEIFFRPRVRRLRFPQSSRPCAKVRAWRV